MTRSVKRHSRRNCCPAGVGYPVGERSACLRDIKMPVLIVGGKSDIIFYTTNAVYLQQHLPNARSSTRMRHMACCSSTRLLFVEHTSIFLRN